MHIYESAHKHGFADADIEHAIEHAVVVADETDDKVLYLGPSRAGNLLEIVTVALETGDEVVIHAMRMRRAYQEWIEGLGVSDE